MAHDDNETQFGLGFRNHTAEGIVWAGAVVSVITAALSWPDYGNGWPGWLLALALVLLGAVGEFTGRRD